MGMFDDEAKETHSARDEIRIPLNEAEDVSDVLKEVRLLRVAIDAQTLTLALGFGIIAGAIILSKGKALDALSS